MGNTGSTSSYQKKLDTSLAGEFYAMHALHRAGIRANLMLGNSKGVDIVVRSATGQMLRLEVKSIRLKGDWFLGNARPPSDPGMFWCFVCFDGKFDDPQISPRAWLIPSVNLRCGLCYQDGVGQWGARTSDFEKKGESYLHAWGLLKSEDSGLPRTAVHLSMWERSDRSPAGFYDAAYADRWVLHGFDAIDWFQQARFMAFERDASLVQTADADEVAQTITALMRAERFVEGSLATRLDLLQALATRAREVCETAG